MVQAKLRDRLTLAAAQRGGLLDAFAEQEEGRRIGPVARAEFDALSITLIKAPRPKDQTSRSASGDGSTGKKTRRGIDRDASR